MPHGLVRPVPCPISGLSLPKYKSFSLLRPLQQPHRERRWNVVRRLVDSDGYSHPLPPIVGGGSRSRPEPLPNGRVASDVGASRSLRFRRSETDCQRAITVVLSHARGSPHRWPSCMATKLNASTHGCLVAKYARGHAACRRPSEDGFISVGFFL